MNLGLQEALRVGPGYATWLPAPGDEDLRRALVELSTQPRSGQLDVAAKLTSDERDLLDAFAERMASLAVRKQRVDLARIGLVALDVAMLDRSDEQYRSLPLLFRAYELLGLDAKRIFQEEAQHLHGIVRADVLTFAAGRGFTVEDAGFVEGRDDGGFRFEAAKTVHDDGSRALLRVWQTDGLYEAAIVRGDEVWDSPKPMTRPALESALRERGWEPAAIRAAIDGAPS